jgi:hypothetical protein
MFFKPKLKFYSEIPAVNEIYPIYPAKDYKRKWVKDCAIAYQKYKKIVNNRSSVITTAKCPGIRKITEAGYIVTTWCDFTIETFADKPYEYSVYYPTGMDRFLKEINYNKPVISDFNMKDSPLKIPTGSNFKRILKIWSPWTIDIPKNWELLFLPIQYDDNPKFTALSGKISGLATDLNIHVLWHETNGRIHIPAGTPLCQLVPIKKETPKVEFLPLSYKVKNSILKNIFLKYHKF